MNPWFLGGWLEVRLGVFSIHALLLASLLQSTGHAEESTSQLWASAELGPVWQSRNEVQIPSDTGTRFSLTSLGNGPKAAFRLYFGYKISESHELRALIAPLGLTFQGRLPSPVNFQGQLFGTQADTEGYYRFNSYRVTYRYTLLDQDAWRLQLGLTAKVRDAEIRLTQGTQNASRSNVGFVPLIHFHLRRDLNDVYAVEFDMDGAWSPYGRAEDISLFGVRRVSPDVELYTGYRTLEGGSSGGGGVYSFAWLHYLTFGAKLNL